MSAKEEFIEIYRENIRRTGRTPCWTTWSTKAIFSPPRPRPGSTGPTRAAQ